MIHPRLSSCAPVLGGLLLLSFVLSPKLVHAQLGGTAGAFTRLGFGARGQGMGNAMSAVNTGLISVHYNPALSPFQEGHVLYGNYSILSLDRKLNQISYTQQIKLYKKGVNKFKDGEDLLSVAGVSAGWTNAGDADIQGYDSDGFKTDHLSVFENQFYVNFGNRFTSNFAAGFNVKFYYSGLYDGVTSSGFGVDLGILYSITDNVNIALVAQEILTKYKWDTGDLYGPERGNATENSFARIIRAGASYLLPDGFGIVAGDVEMFDGEVFLARFGAEIQPVEQLSLRAGVERIDLSDENIDPRPTFGLSFHQPLSGFLPIVNYAFILEPVAPSPTHVLSFALSF